MLQKNYKLLTYVILSLSLNGCATTQATSEITPDPWENWNRKVHSFNDGLDEYVMKPVAKGYRFITPNFVDQSITNLFSNINDIGVTINDVLQGKFSQSGQDAARFLVNSTIGLGGLMDVATKMDLNKHNEDFGQTLGVWGVPTGPYVVLPFFGPSSVRGVVGLAGDTAMNPLSYTGIPFSSAVATSISAATFTTNAVDLRADNLGTEQIADEAAAFGRYEFFRNAYIDRRNFLVLDGNVPEDESFSMELDENFDEEFEQ